jgi:hypothetical protein
VDALTSLLPQLPVDLHQEVVGAMKQVADLEIRSGLAVDLALLTRGELQEECVRIATGGLAELPRPRLVAKLTPLLPVIKAHAGERGLAVLLEAICDIGDWQP